METQRILMRSLAVVLFASVIWTITVSVDAAPQKVNTCCKTLSSQSREQFTDPIIGFRMQNPSPPCLKAIIVETERGKFCFDWRLRWVKEEAKKFFRDQINKGLTPTPPPDSSISEHTPVEGSSQ